MKQFILITAIIWATHELPGQPLTQHLEFQEMGLSFDIPQGWQGELEEDVIVLRHRSLPGMMIITENLSKSSDELKLTAMKGITEEGIQLQPVGDFTSQKTRVEGNYKGYFNGSQVKCYAQGLINGLGSGINIFVLAEDDKFTKEHELEAKKLATSVKFFRSRISVATEEWKTRIAGRQLKYMYTSGGYDANGGGSSFYKTITIDLCTNGQFAYYNNSNYSHDTGDPGVDSGQPEVYTGSGYGNNTANAQGEYRLFTERNVTYLELQFYEGEVYEYLLSLDENQDALLNGERFFITETEVCY